MRTLNQGSPVPQQRTLTSKLSGGQNTQTVCVNQLCSKSGHYANILWSDGKQLSHANGWAHFLEIVLAKKCYYKSLALVMKKVPSKIDFFSKSKQQKKTKNQVAKMAKLAIMMTVLSHRFLI